MTDDTIAPPRPRKIKAPVGDPHSYEETPSESHISQAAKRVVYETDTNGRVLKVKYLTPGDRMRVARVVGGELAKNEIYMGYATLGFAVVEINGEICTPPATAREVEFMVERLGDEGLNAVARAYTENFVEMLRGPDTDVAKN